VVDVRRIEHPPNAALVIPVHPALKAELDAWKRETTSTHILVGEKGMPFKAGNLTQLMNSWLERIGLPSDLNVHCLRKLAAASLAGAGCTTHEIAAITGHKSLAMVELYTKSANQERLAKAAIFGLVNGSENAGNSNPKPLNNKVISC
jgi:integrase